MADYTDDPANPSTVFVDRVRYFDNEFLIDQDFIDDQMFHLAARRRQNQYLHGFGILYGLNIQGTAPATGNGQSYNIVVGAGYDAYGREVFTSPTMTQPITTINRQAKIQYLYLISNEIQFSKNQGGGSAGVQGNNRWVQQPLLVAINADLGASAFDANFVPTATTQVNVPGVGNVNFAPGNFVPIARVDANGNVTADLRHFIGVAFQSDGAPLNVSWDIGAQALRGNLKLGAGTFNSVENPKSGVTVGGTAIAYSATTDLPQAAWKNSVGQIRGLVDHNGYRAERIDQLIEGWRYPVNQNSMFTGPNANTIIGLNGWLFSTVNTGAGGAGNGRVIFVEPAGTAFPSRSIQIQSGWAAGQDPTSSSSSASPGANDMINVFSGALFSAAHAGISFVAIWEAKLVGPNTNIPSGVNSVMSIGLSGAVDPAGATRTNQMGLHKDNVPFIGWTIVLQNASASATGTFRWSPVTKDSPVESNTAFYKEADTWHQFRLELHGSASPYGAVARFFYDGQHVATLPQTTFPTPTSGAGYAYTNLGFMLYNNANSNIGGLTTPIGIAVGPIQMYWNRFTSTPSI